MSEKFELYEKVLFETEEEIAIKILSCLSDKELAIFGTNLNESGEEKKRFLSILRKKSIEIPEIKDRYQLIKEMFDILKKQSRNRRIISKLVEMLNRKTIDERIEINKSLLTDIKRKVTEKEAKYLSGKYLWAMLTSEDVPKRLIPEIVYSYNSIQDPKLKGALDYIDKLCEIIEGHEFDELSDRQTIIGLKRELKQKNGEIQDLENRLNVSEDEAKRLKETRQTQKMVVVKSENNGNERNPTSQIDRLNRNNLELSQRIATLEEMLKKRENEVEVFKKINTEYNKLKLEYAISQYAGKKVCLIGGSKKLNLDDYSEKYKIEFQQIISEKSRATITVPGGHDIYILRVQFMNHDQSNNIYANNPNLKDKIVQ